MSSRAGSKPTTCVVYCRISEDRTGHAVKVDRQERDCRKLAKTLGLTVAKVYVDNDLSASKARVRRPAFEQMLEDAPQAIVVFHEDRLLRQTADLERVIALGVDIHPVLSGRLDLSNPTGRAVARTVIAWAQYEGEHKAERQRAAHSDKAAQGKPFVGSRRTYGYTKDFTAQIPDEAARVRQGFADVLAGVSIRTVAKRWNAEGATSVLGNPWSMPALRLVLTNPTYCGRRRYRGEEVADLVGVEPIVDRDTFAAVGRILADPARRTHLGKNRGGRVPAHLLSHIARCGYEDCGAGLSYGKATGRRAPYSVVRCRECLRIARKSEPIEEFVTAVLLARLRRKDVARLFAVKAPDSRPLRNRAAALRRQREELAADLTVAHDFAAARDRRLREELENVEAQIAAMAGKSALAPFASGTDPAEVWERLDLDARRAVVRELVDVVVMPVGRMGQREFDPNTVVITWRHFTA